MASYRQLLYHIVFRTKNSIPSINPEHADQLFSYITGIIKNKNSHLYRINGTENHLHILTDLHPSYALSDFMRELKVSTSVWMKESGLFPVFDGWADGYGSFTCSYKDLGDLIDYIKSQQEHHKKKSFEEEFRSMIMQSGIKIDERYFPSTAYSAPSELISVGGYLPPVSPEVIHIAPLSAVPLLNPFRIYDHFTCPRIINFNEDL